MISRHRRQLHHHTRHLHHLRLSVLGEYRSAKTRYVLESDVKGTDPRDPVGEVFLIGAFAKVYDLIEGVAGYVRVTNAFNVRYLEPSTYPAKVAGVIPDDIHTRGIEAPSRTYLQLQSRNSGRSSRRRSCR